MEGEGNFMNKWLQSIIYYKKIFYYSVFLLSSLLNMIIIYYKALDVFYLWLNAIMREMVGEGNIVIVPSAAAHGIEDSRTSTQ